MGKGKHINSDEFVNEAIDNIRKDRAMASTLLIELMKILKSDETKHQYTLTQFFDILSKLKVMT